MTFTKSTVAYLAILILLFYAGAVYTFASPPGSPYTVADNITDPSCPPNALNCYVNSVLADNGLTVSGSTVQLGGSLSKNTTIDQNGFNFIISQPVLSLGGTVVTAQGPALINSFPGTISGYLVPNGDVARHITWVNPSGAIATLSGSGDPTFSRGGAEVTTYYDPADTTSGILTLHTYDTPNSKSNKIVLAPEYVDFQIGNGADFRINGNAGSSGYVLTSAGAGSSPVWQVAPTSAVYVDGSSTLYSGTIGAGQGNTLFGKNIFLGKDAGSGATSVDHSIYLGHQSGLNATGASNSIFMGTDSGLGSTAAFNSQFIGLSAGAGAPYAHDSNFIGVGAGFSADYAQASNFIGRDAGSGADAASTSNFIGSNAGAGAVNADNATFLGTQTGQNATNAKNSIFIGTKAGENDTVDNTAGFNETTTFADTSILVGHRTSTGGFSNSIALGAYATNTSSNQFMIGSATRPIDTLVLTGSGGNTCILDVTVASPSCSSDETLKTNVADLSTDTLEQLLRVKTVSYNWRNYPNKGTQIGFLAQDLEQYFPEVVSTAPNGFKTVSYGGMTPILVEALRELNVKVNALALGQTPATVFDGIKNWLGDAGNGIENIFAKKVTTEQLCVRNANGETCLSREDLDRLLLQQQPTLQSTATLPTSEPSLPVEVTPQTDQPISDSVSVSNE